MSGRGSEKAIITRDSFCAKNAKNAKKKTLFLLIPWRSWPLGVLGANESVKGRGLSKRPKAVSDSREVLLYFSRHGAAIFYSR